MFKDEDSDCTISQAFCIYSDVFKHVLKRVGINTSSFASDELLGRDLKISVKGNSSANGDYWLDIIDYSAS